MKQKKPNLLTELQKQAFQQYFGDDDDERLLNHALKTNPKNGKRI